MASIAGLTAFDAWSIRFALFVFGWAGLFFVIVAVIYILATRPPSSTTVTVLIAIIGVTSVVFLVPAQHILDPCRRAGSIGSPSGGETHQPQTFPVTGTSQVGEFLWLGTRLVDGPEEHPKLTDDGMANVWPFAPNFTPGTETWSTDARAGENIHSDAGLVFQLMLWCADPYATNLLRDAKASGRPVLWLTIKDHVVVLDRKIVVRT